MAISGMVHVDRDFEQHHHGRAETQSDSRRVSESKDFAARPHSVSMSHRLSQTAAPLGP
jgi:hypothetical protein